MQKIVLYGAIGIAVIFGLGAIAYFNQQPGTGQGASTQVASAAEVERHAVTVSEGEHILGEADAPITIVEYSSLSCPHCASFHANALPQIKSEWIEAGKVRLVYRHFPLNGPALRAAAVADCLPEASFFPFIEALFRGQQTWLSEEDPIEAIRRFARTAGMDDATFERCVSDEAMMNQILETAQSGQNDYEVNSTPTFLVNGRKVVGALDYAEFERVLSAE